MTREASGRRMLSIVVTSRPATVCLLLRPGSLIPDALGGQATILHSLQYSTGSLAESFAIHQTFERLEVAETHADIIAKGEWLTLEQLSAIRAEARGWLEQGRIFAVSYEGQDRVARYQPDGGYKPRPVVADVIREFWPDADAWTLAAVFVCWWLDCRGRPAITPFMRCRSPLRRTFRVG